ncbi:AP2 domain-containing protein [Rhizobium laguerreae]|uniref:AP2 domain-containing protein n=1 Tax=Rhizobium laguerreae TaxID=1076926 RepID=UPI001C9278B0|nr:AP2 domain-containing protein [Rhizobium laguerreae]MBY3434844.1 hypothetical protein [Rhizobium laguerreae]MBY3448987.1 hypothetical protein [Rhizobium laguerreae]MBY3456761.1 hypothetical protein [Rhizobium laguerreae]
MTKLPTGRPVTPFTPTVDAAGDFYVYAWLRPCGTPFYIGKGKGKRANRMKRGVIFKNIVAKIKRDGAEPTIVKLHDGLTEQVAFEIERAEIAKYGRREFGGLLVNLTEGGEGSSGYVYSDASRAKMSASSRMSPPKAGNFKGVSLLARTGKWIAHIFIDGKLRHLGYFDTEEAAARAYDSAAFAWWGAACYLNFPDEAPDVPPERRSNAEAQRMRSAVNGLKGTSFIKSSGRWRAVIKVNGRQRYLGTFLTQEDAARKYDAAAHEMWGDKCSLNFPRQKGEGE